MKKLAKDLTQKELEKYNHPFTVGDLLDYIKKNNVSRESIILVQRIEDYYYEDGNWKTIKKEGEFYHQSLKEIE